jgi:hypothetical protein
MRKVWGRRILNLDGEDLYTQTRRSWAKAIGGDSDGCDEPHHYQSFTKGRGKALTWTVGQMVVVMVAMIVIIHNFEEREDFNPIPAESIIFQVSDSFEASVEILGHF